MSKEKFPEQKPESWPDLPETELQIIPVPHKDKTPHPAIIIGPGPLDEEHLPGSQPLEKDEDENGTHFNS